MHDSKKRHFTLKGTLASRKTRRPRKVMVRTADCGHFGCLFLLSVPKGRDGLAATGANVSRVAQLMVQVRNLGFHWLHRGPKRDGVSTLRLFLHMVDPPTLVVLSYLAVVM